MAGGSFFNAGIDRSGIYVVVENVRSLFNVGAIFRSADGVGASGVLLTGFTGQPPRKEISRVALGADEYVPWAYYPDALSAIGDLREQGVQVLALESSPESIDYREQAFHFPVAFVVGHEVEGVRPETLEACDSIIHLPMLGQKVSLNVSVAAGIMLYRLLEAKTSRDSA
ncbi:MAG: RNA methyltransferase [Gemmatimonadetes bacterium]|nr:RNA methyltransferase [Gemmatimonadota bacterium]|tara:strand:- start:1537 stop:2046 length:510 start_codon:yes stop_codon:yes gene_type:complete